MVQGGTNLPRVRDYNQGVVLEIIRKGAGASRVEIAQKTGLTAQTVTNIVRRLLDEQLVIEDGVHSSNGGKPRVKLRINPDARYAIGVALDRDEVFLIIMALDGRILARSHILPEHGQGLPGVVQQIARAIHLLINKAEINPDKIVGVGVGCPGPMDHEQGIFYEPFDLRGWGNSSLKVLLQEQVGYHVIVDNDATASAIGELWVGGAQEVHNFAFIFMGAGVGAGLYIHNQIYRGATTNAGEFGHMTLNLEGPACFCGNRGCVEVYCGPNSMISQVRQRLSEFEPSSLQALAPAQVNLNAIAQAALAGDALALEVVKQAARMLARGVVNLVSLLDIELVVLGGKTLRDIGSIFQHEVRQALKERLITRNVANVRIELSAAGEDTGAVGAAALVLYEFYSPRLAGLG